MILEHRHVIDAFTEQVRTESTVAILFPAVPEDARWMIQAVSPTGSRVICSPVPEDADEDEEN